MLSQRDLISFLFETFETTLETLVEHLGLSQQAVRYNLRRLEELSLIHKVSEKIRDRNAIYRFASE